MERTQIANLLIGLSRQGKTTFSHFIYGSHLKIETDGEYFSTIALEHITDDMRIGNEGVSVTVNANLYDNFCDLPGYDDTRGKSERLSAVLKYYKEIQRFDCFRFILVFDEMTVKISRCKEFLNHCNEIIETFGLDSANIRRMHLLITNSSQEFINRLPEMLTLQLKDEQNFLIEGIKNRRLKISSFNKPILLNDHYAFSEENKQTILENINNTDFFVKADYKHDMLEKIYEIINSLRESDPNRNVVIISKNYEEPKNNEGNFLFASSDILIIDRSIELEGEILVIDSPIVIVKAGKNEKHSITLRGKKPVIKFSSNVKTVINGESLILMTSILNKSPKFLDPTKNKFNQSYDFIILESVCINGWWTENASHNNKFIDLIVYFKRGIGRIEVDDGWKVKKIDCDIYMKLHINECMRTKNSIVENFKSLRSYNDIRKYLEATNKEINEENVKFIETYIVNLPSIFQIFMKNKLFTQVSDKSREIEDLRNIRKILLKRYVNLIEDFHNNRTFCKIETPENYRKHHNDSRSFILTKFPQKNDSMHNNPDLINEIDNCMIINPNNEDTNKFLLFYNCLSLTKDKSILFNYGITGDKSIYLNFEAVKKGIKLGEIIITNNGMSYITGGTLISISTFVSVVGGIAGREAAVFVAPSLAAELVTLSATAIGISIFAATFVLDVGVNLICVAAKSGYYRNSIKIEAKDICYDCVIKT